MRSNTEPGKLFIIQDINDISEQWTWLKVHNLDISEDLYTITGPLIKKLFNQGGSKDMYMRPSNQNTDKHMSFSNKIPI